MVAKVHPISHLSSLCYVCYIMRDVCPGGVVRGGRGGGEFFSKGRMRGGIIIIDKCMRHMLWMSVRAYVLLAAVAGQHIWLL